MEEGGGGHNYYSLALRLLDLHGICNGSLNRMEDGGGGGGTHPSATALGLRISAPPPTHPKFPRFCLELGGGTKMFYPP